MLWPDRKPTLLLSVLCLPALSPGAEEVSSITLENALRKALLNQPVLEIQEELAAQREGILLEESGAFDWFFRGEVRHGFERTPLSATARQRHLQQGGTGASEVRDFETHRTEYSGVIGSLFRTGVSTDARLSFQREDVRTIDPDPPVNRSVITMGLNIPLRQGLGREATGALEQAARLEWEASQKEILLVASEVTRDTASVYWQALFAARVVALREDARQRARDLLENIEQLVEADERPRSEIGPTRAFVSEQEVELLQARSREQTTRRNFGRSLGLKTDRLTDIPVPVTDFPSPTDLTGELENLSHWLDRALEQRADLQGSQIREKSALALRRGAKSDLKTRLDLRLEASYAQVSENSDGGSLLTPFRSRQTGPGAFAILEMDWPFENREARGRLRQSQARYRQNTWQSEDLRREINTSVASLFHTLQSNIHEIAQARETVELYKESLRNELERFQMGMATIFDVVQTQDRLTSAELFFLDRQRDYAENLARLRFSLGDLVEKHGQDLQLDAGKLLKGPQSNPSSSLSP